MQLQHLELLVYFAVGFLIIVALQQRRRLQSEAREKRGYARQALDLLMAVVVGLVLAAGRFAIARANTSSALKGLLLQDAAPALLVAAPE